MKFKRSNSNILGPCQSTDQPSCWWWLPIGNPTEVTLNKYGLWPVGSKTMLCSAWKLEFHARTRTSQGMEMIWGLWSTKVQVTWVKILVSLLSKRPQTTLRAFYLISPFPLTGAIFEIGAYGVPSKSQKSFICDGVRQTITLKSPGKGAPPSTPCRYPYFGCST